MCLSAGARIGSLESLSGTCGLNLVDGSSLAVLDTATVGAPLAVGASAADASFFGTVPDGAFVEATCGGACAGTTKATLAHPGTALLPLTGQLAADEVVVALVWATAGTDLDLRLGFRADDDERCLVSAGRPKCGDATHTIVGEGVEFISIKPFRATDYHVWVHAAAGTVEAADAYVYVFDAGGLVSMKAAAPPVCGATTAAEAAAQCIYYDDPAFVNAEAGKAIWAAPEANRLLGEHTEAMCLEGLGLGSTVKPLVVERQRHYTAEAFDTAQLVDSCDAPRECDAADHAVWHCSAIIERGVFRCPGAMRRMVFCDPGYECDPAAVLDVAVTDAAAVRAAMCVAPPTPAPTLQPIALTLDF